MIMKAESFYILTHFQDLNNKWQFFQFQFQSNPGFDSKTFNILHFKLKSKCLQLAVIFIPAGQQLFKIFL